MHRSWGGSPVSDLFARNARPAGTDIAPDERFARLFEEKEADVIVAKGVGVSSHNKIFRLNSQASVTLCDGGSI